MKSRQYLKKDILLCGESDGAVFKRTFAIAKKISEGSSAVSYEASYGNSGRGVLKEFYPQDAYGLERTAAGQLIHSPDFESARERFRKAEKEYVEPYEMLMAAKQNAENSDLSTFIPAFEIYHGCDENGNIVGTTYIWTPEPKLETFDKICDEIHKYPGRNPEHKLVTVLSAIESLAKCICALHSADMIHRDIKPSNFGFLKRGKETLTQTLSLFDINSVCSVYGKVDDVVGTEGYMEPEAGYEAANNQTDIYSIGAVLFCALIVTDDVKEGGYCYERGYYDRLREMVAESALIRASEANSHPRLRNILTGILKRCLCERTYRYANCEELLEDLETALYYALPSDIAGKRRAGGRWVLTDAERSLDVNREKNSFLSIRYHLYEHPLYQCCKSGEEPLNVLVIGFGNYGQKFLDACLQNGQMPGKKLHVTVVSDDLTDRDIYLSERPQLPDFFRIDGALEGEEDAYGDITFETAKLERGKRSVNADLLQNMMCERYDGGCPHYVFIALGDDALNLAAAKACKTAAGLLKADCIVSYVCEDAQVPADNTQALCPLYVNRDIRESTLYPEIERMAFNTHLVWEKDLNVDYGTVRAAFRKAYNHDACVSSVLALKYKLYGMGIDPETTGYERAARQFKGMLADKAKRGLRNELIWIEHRRWVTEKLCLGWRRIDNLEDCAGGVTKDERNKRHVCMVRSRPDRKLAVEYRSGGNYDKWDKASKSELSELDDLDRMSVELHRMFVRKAKNVRAQNLLSGNNMTAVRRLIEGNKKAVVAFQEWFTCLKDIWNEDIEKVRIYKGLKAAFLNAADTLPEDRRRVVREQVKAFETVFYPILASMEYRDWKQEDTAFIDNIPFVLTYTENAYLVIPYATSNNTEIFMNVAAAAVVNPERIIYLYLIEKKQDLIDLKESVPYVIQYMRKKRFKAAVEFVLACVRSAQSFVNEEVEKEIIKLGEGRIRQVKRIKLAQVEAVPEELGAYLKKRRVGKRFFAIQKNEARLSYMLQGAGFYNWFAGYRFDPSGMKFHAMTDCDMLGYIKKTPYITVADMAAFRLSASESSNQPEFFDDYRDLWEKYSENSGSWKRLCCLLGKYAEENDILASFSKKQPPDKQTEPQKYRYILPFVCSDSCAKIVRYLKEQEILEQGSRVNGYTTDSCEVIIVDRCGHRREYNKLFSRVYALMQPDSIALHLHTKSRAVDVTFDDLVVDGLQITKDELEKLRSLLKYFRDKGYIINFAVGSGEKISFTYGTGKIKELLTTAGKILEIYTYHKAKELGSFDDVVSSFEIDWEGTEVKSEFDCILTKGFRSLFVECKARPDIAQDYYFKLAGLAKQFGINATAVLIADTREREASPVNSTQRTRGKMMDVVTIWKENEINNIGQTLFRVITGNYQSEEE